MTKDQMIAVLVNDDLDQLTVVDMIDMVGSVLESEYDLLGEDTLNKIWQDRKSLGADMGVVH